MGQTGLPHRVAARHLARPECAVGALGHVRQCTARGWPHAEVSVARRLCGGGRGRVPSDRGRGDGRGRLRWTRCPRARQQPILVTNWAQFLNDFGDFIEGSYLAHAVYGYFLNGGGACYVVRIGARWRDAGRPGRTPTAKSKDIAGLPGPALEPGPAGNDVSVEVAEAPARGGHLQAHRNVARTGARRCSTTSPRARARTTSSRSSRSSRSSSSSRRSATPARRARARPRARSPSPARTAPSRSAGQPGRLRRRLGRSDRLRRSRGDRRGHDARGPGPHGRLPAGRHRPRGRPGRPAGDDRALRADGRPRRDPRCAARTQRPAGPGVARRQGRLRLEVRDAVLALDQGLRPALLARPAFIPPSGHIAGIWARNDDTPRRPQGARERGRPRRDLGSSCSSPRPSTTS